MNYGCFYEGSVPMKPEIDKRDFYCDDEISYPVPKIFYECTGDKYDSWSMSAWNDDSVIMVGDNRIVKYTEYNDYEVGFKNESGEIIWLEGRYADVLGWEDEDVVDYHKMKNFKLEEYDLKSGKKSRYKLVLEEVLDMDERDNRYVESLTKNARADEDTEYVLTDTYNRFD